MSVPIQRSRFLESFVCTGDRCPDTCCKGWGMQVDAVTVEKYAQRAPELLEVVTSGEAEHIMRRDPTTDHCVKFDAGWCGVQKQYGTEFLGDACHFFPRVTRRLGEATLMTATLSCPEVVRLVMEEPDPFVLDTATTDRLPHGLSEYLPNELTSEDALLLHRAFVDAALDPSFSAGDNLLRIGSVARSLKVLPMMAWPKAVHFYLRNATTRIPKAEPNPADPFNLLHALFGLVCASKKTNRPRLTQTIDDMQQALRVTLNPETVGIALSADSASAYHQMQSQYQSSWSKPLEPILRKWIAAQLSVALFPFSGFGHTLEDRVTILVVRYAIMKLAVMSGCVIRGGIQSDDVYRAIQSLSRFLDHLSDPTLTLSICQETGWNREQRQVALVSV